MKNGFKKLIALVISVVMLISMLPTAFAEGDYGFVDFPTGWSHAAMAAAVDNGLLRGFEGNEIRPRVTLTRAEFATIITRAFGAKTKADISRFTDVSEDAWYYDSIAMAVQMGILNGMTETTMVPDNSITRQEVFTAVARALVMSSDDLSALDKFDDSDLISDYAKGHMAYLTQKGYVNGDDLGNINPKKHITREEFAQFMYNLIKTYITEPGTYTGDMEGIVVVRVGNVTIKNAKINEDLVIGDGAGTDAVKLQGVTIDGRFLVRGGTITVSNTTIANGLVVNNPNGVTVFNNFRSAFKSIIENTKAQFKTAGGGGGTPPSTSPSVSPSPSPSVSPSPGPSTLPKAYFYNGYSTDQNDLIAEVSAAQDGTVALPAIEDSSYKKVYEKDATTASVYTDSYVHKIAPSYWYLNTSNVLVPFTASTAIEADTNVFLLAKTMSLMLTLNNSDAFLVKTPYNEETRAMDSVKGLAFSGKSQLKLAVDTNVISDEIPDAAIEKLAKTGVIDTDRNIQVMHLKIPISTLVPESLVNNMVKQYVRDGMHNDAKLNVLLDILPELNLADIASLTDKAAIRDYIHNLSSTDKTSFADDAYNALKVHSEYRNIVNALMNHENFPITATNKAFVQVISGAIRELTLDTALTHVNNATLNRLVDLFGRSHFTTIFNRMRDNYCNGLDVAIAANATSYTTDLTITFDPINEIYKPMYDAAQPKIVEKLQNANVYYDRNKFVQYLANHDILANLLDGDTTLANGDDTGYTLRSIQDYYEYLYMLLVVGDDALCWYGDDANITDAELDAIYDAMVGKMTLVHNKVDGILINFAADGRVPAKAQKVLNKVKQLNDLFLRFESKARTLVQKYLNSTIYDDIVSGNIGNSSKAQKVADLLFGQEEPVVTLDTVYTVFYNYDDNMQEALRKAVQNGKLKKAVEKFEASAFGSLLQLDAVPGDLDAKRAEILANGTVTTDFTSVYDFLVIVSEYGIAPFATDKNDVTVVDAYQATIGKIAFKVKRHFQ